MVRDKSEDLPFRCIAVAPGIGLAVQSLAAWLFCAAMVLARILRSPDWVAV